MKEAANDDEFETAEWDAESDRALSAFAAQALPSIERIGSDLKYVNVWQIVLLWAVSELHKSGLSETDLAGEFLGALDATLEDARDLEVS